MTKNRQNGINASLARLKKVIQNRPLLIWGARGIGGGMCRAAERASLNVKGFVDNDVSFKNRKVLGYDVCHPGDIEKFVFDEKPFLIISSISCEEAIMLQALKMGFKKEMDIYLASDLCGFEYIIDVVGTCNLRCPSCARGNFGFMPKAGIMSVEKFRQIIKKILNESPNVSSITLYNWSEPFLHPKLPDLIHILRERKIFSSLSSNFNIERNFKDVVLAKPDMLKISLSGYYQGTYEVTHANGNINIVKSNLYRLRYLIDKYHSDLVVEVIYHKYKHNIGEDYDKMKQLCFELDFHFAPIIAYFTPVEKVINYVEKDFSEEDKKLMDMLLVNIDDALKIARLYKNRPCQLLEKNIAINWDGSVSLCCASFDPNKTIVKEDFLSVSLSEIQEAKYKNSLCNKCIKYGINQYYFETSQSMPIATDN